MRFLLTILVSIFCIFLFAQNEENKPYQLYKLAEFSDYQGDKYSAIQYLEKYIKIKPNNKNALEKLGQLYLGIHDYTNAKKIYLQLSKSYSNSLYYYNLAILYKKTAKYDSCIHYFESCKKSGLPKLEKQKIDIELAGCKMGKEISRDENTTIVHLDESLNSKHIDISPAYVNDSTIIFSSLVSNKNNTYSIYEDANHDFSKLYYASKINGVWKKTKELPNNINVSKYDIANGVISLDGKRFYFTKCFKNWENKKICNIYMANIEDDNFTSVRKLGQNINSLNYTSTQPALGSAYNKNIEVIYFSSDRPGGFGGKDIWYTTYNKKKNTFISPRNVGRKINTSWDEITPFYNNKTKTLYYSTNGMVSYGGFDIYKTTGSLKSWMKSRNTGNQINSYADELYFVLSNNLTEGFFVSNREESFDLENQYCCFDIYAFKYKNPEQLKLRGTLVAQLDPTIKKYLEKGITLVDTSKNYLTNTTVSLYLTDTESKDSLFIISDTTDHDGSFEFFAEPDQDYKILIHNDIKLHAEIEVTTKDVNRKLVHEIEIDDQQIEFLPDGPLIIEHIYYDFGESRLQELSMQILDSTLISLMKERREFKIEIRSHTDSIGDENFNLNLSNERAKNVVNYLLRKGIDKDRLVAKGFGETLPIAPNSNSDGSDNPEGREKNRRTEFVIIGNEKSTGITIK